jgi:hypothetical protein
MNTNSTVTYYAIADANGPISVELEGATAEDATAYAEQAEYGDAEGEDDGMGRNWVDSARTDMEDALEIDGSGMSISDFRESLREAGARFVRDLGDNWELWAVETGGAS